MDERPRAVYLAACDTVAAAFAPAGFTYARSISTLTRRSGDLAFRIGFQSSHRNVPGQWVAIHPYATVHSRTLKQWRQAQPSPIVVWDRVAGGNVENFTSPPELFGWNLAPPATRDATVQTIIAMLQRLAVPYFEGFRQPRSVVARFQTQDIPSMNVTWMLEYTLCFGTRDEANALLRRLIVEHLHWEEDYHHFLAKYRHDGVPNWMPTYAAEELAVATILYDLDQPTLGAR